MKKNLIKLLFVSSFLFTGCSETKKENTLKNTKQSNISANLTEKEATLNVVKEDYAIISTSYGEMEVKFFEGAAPKHVESFKTHAKNGYFNGTIFHRVIPGFMIQGGDPSGTGHGDYGKFPGYEFEDELNNQRPYEKGILAMANRGPNTNGSQFFIMHADYALPYSYTIFGQVIVGFDVIDKIASVQTDSADKPTTDVVISTVEVTEN